LVQLLHKNGAFRSKRIDHESVVNDLVPHVDGRSVLGQRQLDDLDRAIHASAKPARRRQYQRHFFPQATLALVNGFRGRHTFVLVLRVESPSLLRAWPLRVEGVGRPAPQCGKRSYGIGALRRGARQQTTGTFQPGPEYETSGTTVIKLRTAAAPRALQILFSGFALTLLAGCGMSSLTSGIGGGMLGGSSSSSTEVASVSEEQLLSAAKADYGTTGSSGIDLAHGCPRFVIWPR